MNDRFKYRVWDKETKDFNCPFYLDKNANLYYDSWCEGLEQEEEEERYIIQQCTGLKDKNGNLIYEGDVVSLDNGELKGIAIRHEKLDEYYGCVFIKLISKHETLYKPTVFAESEVIGNIYENPDMIEEK